MFIRQRPTGPQFDHETAFDKKICVILSKSLTVFVGHPQGMLLFETNPGLSQTIRQTILIHLLQASMSKGTVQSEADVPSPIAQRQHLALIHACASLAFTFRGFIRPTLSALLVLSLGLPLSLCLLWPTVLA